jgi:hydrogenase maturation protein HypF
VDVPAPDPEPPRDREAGTTRREVTVRGVVQGVGFRPYVYALAGELSLTGRVCNTGSGVLVEVQGGPRDVAAFCARVGTEAPRLAEVTEVNWRDVPVVPGNGFTIESSRPGTGRTLVPADVATCPDCLAEVQDPADRRYRHPFVSCTACGPRFTIVTGLPYDRSATTMAGFPLCAECAAEYTDPTDRRFHAQPIACHACGPELELLVTPPGAPGGVPVTGGRRDAALVEARRLLAEGRIVAVKGLGGYHLACDATSPAAVDRLRRRKRRGDKPFAVLVGDLATARRLCHLDAPEAALLSSPRTPIVLLSRRRGDGADPTGATPHPIAAGVAPGSPDLGLLLPPTALHRLLLGIAGDPPGPLGLVLTSGNLAGEPIVTDDAEAVRRLTGIADAWLWHDRPIHVPCDDSVTRVVDGQELPIRRSRGHAPLPVPLPFGIRPALATGGDLKNTLGVGRDRCVWLSAHLGDMDDLATQQAFGRAAGHLSDLVGVRPELLVTDLHPGYRSAGWARDAARSATWSAAATTGVEATSDSPDAAPAGSHPGATRPVLPVTRVQHHHAHLAAVMAENGLDGSVPVIGFAFDGTGFGPDGTVWGGEVLVVDYDGYQRPAHLSPVPLPGGDTAVRRPYRMALAHLEAAGVPWESPRYGSLPCVVACPPTERRVLAHQLRSGLGCVPTSSAGRLFDAVASIGGWCQVSGFEAQAAVAVEASARELWSEAAARDVGPDERCYPLPLVPAPSPPSGPDGAGCGDRTGTAGSVPGSWVLDCGALVRAVAEDVLAGTGPELVADRFHRALATAVVVTAGRVRELTGLDTVALSGGVFCNTVLLRLVTRWLDAASFRVLRHRRVPTTDGGLALGQLAVAARTGAPSTGSGRWTARRRWEYVRHRG